jgi:hypothetical protein
VPDLTAASDTGVSNTDNITRLNNSSPGSALSFTVGNTVSGATVELIYAGSVIGSAVASGTSTVVTTNGTTVIGEGDQAISARQTEPGKSPSNSGNFFFTVDTVAPIVVIEQYDREETQDLDFVFDESLAGTIDAADFNVLNLTTSNIQPVGTVSTSANTTTVTFTGLLPDGRYRVTIDGDGVSDAAGNPLAEDQIFEFVQLGGDASGDDVVNFLDLLIVQQNYGASPASFSEGDFNYDDIVNFNDLLVLQQNYGIAVVNSPAAGSPFSAGATIGAPPRPLNEGLFGETDELALIA